MHVTGSLVCLWIFSCFRLNTLKLQTKFNILFSVIAVKMSVFPSTLSLCPVTIQTGPYLNHRAVNRLQHALRLDCMQWLERQQCLVESQKWQVRRGGWWSLCGPVAPLGQWYRHCVIRSIRVVYIEVKLRVVLTWRERQTSKQKYTRAREIRDSRRATKILTNFFCV